MATKSAHGVMDEEVVVGWNQTAADFCMHELFEQQAEQTPDRVAVVYEGEQLTYDGLNRRANQLAHYLRGLGVGPEAKVGLCVERSVEMMVGLLGVMKAGGAYLPLDVSYPPERLAYMIENGECGVTITARGAVEKLAGIRTALVDLSSDWGRIGEGSEEKPEVRMWSENAAYVIYTSGSTGKPKGVAIEHRQIVNYVAAIIERLGIRPNTSFAMVQPLTFDSCATVIYSALCTGGCLHVVSKEKSSDPQALSEYFSNHEIDCLKIVPSHLRALKGNGSKVMPNKVLVIGGEGAAAEWIKEWRREKPGCRIMNHYGPTEATVGAVTQGVDGGERWETSNGKVMLGRPIRNAQTYILDEEQEPVPVGAGGELYIGGEGVARGYVKRGGETGEKFVPNPYGGGAGSRMYRTGDRARYDEDGRIEFLGRVDNQVKVRGYRIELGEVEAALAQHEGVEQAVVVAIEEEGGARRLVGYVVMKEEAGSQALREYLGGRLPDYMVPGAIVELEEMPLAANGKIDRRALPKPERSSQYVEPQTTVEEIVCGIWADVLRVEKVGIHDKFFELGGHSLLGMQVVARVRNTLGVEVPLRSLLTNQTAAVFAAEVEQQRRIGEAPVEVIGRAARNRELPLSFAQQSLWFNDQLNPGGADFNIPCTVRLRGLLDVDALRRSLDEIVQRHEVLRTRFPSRDGRARQEIQEAGELQTDFFDLMQSDEAGREQKLQAVLEDEAKRGFDLSRGPLIRATLIRMREDEHVLTVNMHYIVSDAWSIRVIVREFAQLYDAFSRGQESSLPEPEIQYADYAVWQREWLQGEVLDRQLQYWKRQLEGVSVLELPTDRPAPAAASHQGASEKIRLSEELTEKLRQMSRREGVTLFMTLLAGFQVLLARYSGQEDIAVGISIAGRNREETEGLVGLFIKALVIRVNVGSNPSVPELLARVREAALGAYAHQDLPFEKLVEEIRPERGLSHQPLFKVWFVSQDIPAEKIDLRGLSVEVFPGDDSFTKADLMLALTERQGLTGTLRYSTDLFDRRRIKRMLSHYESILEGMAASEEPDSKEHDIEREQYQYTAIN